MSRVEGATYWTDFWATYHSRKVRNPVCSTEKPKYLKLRGWRQQKQSDKNDPLKPKFHMFDGLFFESMPNARKTMERPCAFVDSIPVPLHSKFADCVTQTYFWSLLCLCHASRDKCIGQKCRLGAWTSNSLTISAPIDVDFNKRTLSEVCREKPYSSSGIFWSGPELFENTKQMPWFMNLACAVRDMSVWFSLSFEFTNIMKFAQIQNQYKGLWFESAELGESSCISSYCWGLKQRLESCFTSRNFFLLSFPYVACKQALHMGYSEIAFE